MTPKRKQSYCDYCDASAERSANNGPPVGWCVLTIEDHLGEVLHNAELCPVHKYQRVTLEGKSHE